MIYPENTTSNNETLSIDENGVMRGKYLAQPTTIKVSISDLKKIEPLNPRNVSSEYWNATHENRDKLNEVIEKLNLVMDYLNKGVK